MNLITFGDCLDHRVQEAKKPTVARFVYKVDKVEIIKYIVIGTLYGYLHTVGGDLRTWGSYSGARKAALRYIASQ